MVSKPKYAPLLLNLLVALAISLVVNFSYVLLLIVDQNTEGPRQSAQSEVRLLANEGTLRVDPDGHGYLLFEAGDSVYVPVQRIRRMNLAEGDRLLVDVLDPRAPGGHAVMNRLHRRNGEVFDYSTIYHNPSRVSELVLQLIYYFVVSFTMLSILTSTRRNFTSARFARYCLWCLLAAVALYVVAPVTEWHSRRLVLNFMGGHIWDYMLVLKCSFAVAVSMLYGWVYVLNSKQQAVVTENERLKTENLKARYDMLVGQINPHFFFNSLNSLSMLVRENEQHKALTYIDQLSYTFRYIIQNGQSMLIALDEELKYAEAYGYLFKIRYADKLFVDFDIEPHYLTWMLPALSLQPLIDNAVKHNTVTRTTPLCISIRTEGAWLVVSNAKVPKFEPEPSTGIGLANLRSRWHLITGRDIEVIDTEREFTVRMPLQNPAI